jgi:hypothetical protein
VFHVKHRRVGKLIWRIPLGIIDSGSAAYMVLRRKLRLRELRRVIRILIGGWPERTGRSVVVVAVTFLFVPAGEEGDEGGQPRRRDTDSDA